MDHLLTELVGCLDAFVFLHKVHQFLSGTHVYGPFDIWKVKYIVPTFSRPIFYPMDSFIILFVGPF